MSSSKSRGSTQRRHSLPRSYDLNDIELGDFNSRHDHESSIPLINDHGESSKQSNLPSPTKATTRRLRRSSRMSKYYPASLFSRLRWTASHILMLLGFYQALIIMWSLLDGICPDDAKSVLAAFGLDHRFHKDTSSISDAVIPIQCHSHNDYWRVRPFFTAIEMGCTSVEADVWLENGDLLVGHTKSSVSRNHTLRNMYLDPILTVLDEHNPALAKGAQEMSGIFSSDPEQSLVLLIDFKVDGEAIWPVLNDQLKPLREKKYLTHFDGSTVVSGPITVVVSGDASFEDVVRNLTYRDIFYDAPLELMGGKVSQELDLGHDIDYLDDSNIAPVSGKRNATIEERSRIPTNPAVYSPINSYYASVSFKHSIGYPWHSSLSHAQIEKIRGQIQGAHARGLKVRYWGVPAWPLGVRNYLWRVLVREGVDVLSVDDVEAVTREDWGPKKGGWNKKWWP